MDEQEKSLKFLTKLRSVLEDDAITREDFTRAFKLAMEVIAKSELALTSKQEKRLQEIYDEMRSRVAEETTRANNQTFATLKQRSLESIDSLFNRLRIQDRFAALEKENTAALARVDARLEEIPNLEALAQEAAALVPQQEITKETAEEIVDKINSLPTEGDENKIDASHIKNLPKPTVTHNHAGGVTNLWNLADVDVSGITAGQTLEWTGVYWRPVTPAGGGGTPVWGEDLSSQGPGTEFTLDNEPVAGSVRLFRGGAYQVRGEDYTIADDVITLAHSLSEGEKLVADYSY